MRREFQKTTATWDTDVEFEILRGLDRTDATVIVGTDNEIYNYVDGGTKPHKIRPKRAGYPLRFGTGYVAKTQVGRIGSTQGGTTGPDARAYEVNHPGTKAREFSKTISENEQEQLARDLQAAITRGLQKAGLL